MTLALTAVLATLLFLLVVLYRMWRGAHANLKAVRFNSQSLSTRYGKMTEQFIPFIPTYPWDPERFRFIGSPIDGIQFENDRIILVEFKTGESHLSPRQRRIRELVGAGQVEFKEVRLDRIPVQR